MNADERRYTEAEWRRATQQETLNIMALSEAKGYMQACRDHGFIKPLPLPSPDVQALLDLLRQQIDEAGPGPEAFGGAASSGIVR